MSGVSRGTYRPNGLPALPNGSQSLPSDKGMYSSELDMTDKAILKVQPEALQGLNAATNASSKVGAQIGASLMGELAVQDDTLAAKFDKLIDIQQQMLDLMLEKFG